MKVCILSRYPPMEGGVSSSTYWISKWLGKSGVKTIVVSNSWSCSKNIREYINIDEISFLQPKNVTLYATNPFITKGNELKDSGIESHLLSLGLEAYEKEGFDVIFGFYLIPYGVAAWGLSKKTNLPLVIKHAGSDFYRIRKGSYIYLVDLFKDSKFVLSSLKEAEEMFGKDKIVNLRVSVPPEFNVSVKPAFQFNEPTIGIIGKYGPYKRIYELTRALERMDTKYKLFILCDAEGKSKLESIISREVKKKTVFMNFTAPWNMPSIYKSIDILYCGEKGFVIEEHFPLIPLEGMSSGRCVLMSDELFKKYSKIFNLQEGVNVVKVDSTNPKDIKRSLEHLLEDESQIKLIGKEAAKIPNASYQEYIKSLINVLRRASE